MCELVNCDLQKIPEVIPLRLRPTYPSEYFKEREKLEAMPDACPFLVRSALQAAWARDWQEFATYYGAVFNTPTFRDQWNHKVFLLSNVIYLPQPTSKPDWFHFFQLAFDLILLVFRTLPQSGRVSQARLAVALRTAWNNGSLDIETILIEGEAPEPDAIDDAPNRHAPAKAPDPTLVAELQRQLEKEKAAVQQLNAKLVQRELHAFTTRGSGRGRGTGGGRGQTH